MRAFPAELGGLMGWRDIEAEGCLEMMGPLRVAGTASKGSSGPDKDTRSHLLRPKGSLQRLFGAGSYTEFKDHSEMKS